MRNLLTAVLIILVGLISLDVSAQDLPVSLQEPKLKLTEAVCIDELFNAISLEIELPRIPIGCELVDCCPECGYRPDIELSIAFASGLESDVEVEFENLEPEEAAALTVKNGSLTGTTLQFEDRARLAGIPRKLTTDSVEMQPTITVPPFASPGDVSQEDVDELRDMTLSVWQSVNGLQISSAEYKYELKVCSPGVVFDPPDFDQLELLNNDHADEAAILLDARPNTGCLEGHRTDAKQTATYANLKSSTGACRQEIAVFSEGDAAALLADEDQALWLDWTDADGDIQEVDLAVDPWAVPVRVWIAAPETTAEVYLLNSQLSALLPIPLVFDPNNTPDKLLVRAEDELDEANILFDMNKAGIDLKSDSAATIVNEFTGIVAIYSTVLTFMLDCNQAEDIITDYQALAEFLGLDPVYEEGALNVYYISSAWVAGGTITGLACPHGLLAVGSGAYETTLAHEFGHAFSLEHVNHDESDYDCDNDGTEDFGSNNIMWAGASTARTEFSIGQDWHMSFNSDSILNWPTLSNTRTGGTRSCGDGSGSAICECYGTR